MICMNTGLSNINQFDDKELTIEEIIDELRISDRSYQLLKKSSLLKVLKHLYNKDNEISICHSDLRNVFDGGEIVEIFSNSEIEDCDICKWNKNNCWLILFVQDRNINEKIFKMKNCLFAFKQSNKKEIIGFVVENV